MADKTGIEWTDATWNVITGCSVVSPGCTNCYAMRLAGTRLRTAGAYMGLTQATKAGPVWTGEVRLQRHLLDQPLRWTRPRRIFVNAMGDLFHENVQEHWIDVIFAVMALGSRHTYQVLTKRADRMRRYLDGLDAAGGIGRVHRFAKALGYLEAATGRPFTPLPFVSHPLPNVWLGVSAEDQPRWDERTAHLRRTNAAVRWVSAEPLLGRIEPTGLERLDWLVVGGESGPDARPMHPSWAAELEDACSWAGVPFLFKQWGDWKPLQANDGEWPADAPGHIRLTPDGRRVAEGWPMQRVGKHHAGRLLAGRLHDAYPQPEPAHV